MWPIKSLLQLEDEGLVQLGRGKVISKKDLADNRGSFPVYSSSKVGDGKFGEYGLYMFDEELITWSVDGGGRLFHREKHRFSITNVTGFLRILDTSCLSYKYLFHALCLLHSKINFDWVKKAHPSVLRKEYLHIPIPPLAEQQRIVAKLDAAFAEIDRAVGLCQKKIVTAESIYTNKLTRIFEEKGEDWVNCSLKEITTKIGSGATPRGGKAAYKEDGLSLIRSMNVYDMDFSWKELAKIDDKQAQKLSNVEVEKDDVLLNITGASVARCTLVPTDALPARVNQHVAIIRTDKSRLIPKLLAYGLVARINKETLLGVGNNAGATRQAITKRDIEEFVFSFPLKLDAQRNLIEEISNIKVEALELAELYRRKQENFIALKSAILAQELQPPQSQAA